MTESGIYITPGWAAVLLTAGANVVLVIISLGRLIFVSKKDLSYIAELVARHEERLAAGADVFQRLESSIHENTKVTSELSCHVAELRGALPRKDRS